MHDSWSLYLYGLAGYSVFMTNECANKQMQLLTIAQAAQRLSTSSQFVRRRVRSGEISAITLSDRTIRLAESDLEAWLAGHRGALPAQPNQFRKAKQ